jgi:hypothetical protein
LNSLRHRHQKILGDWRFNTEKTDLSTWIMLNRGVQNWALFTMGSKLKWHILWILYGKFDRFLRYHQAKLFKPLGKKPLHSPLRFLQHKSFSLTVALTILH